MTDDVQTPNSPDSSIKTDNVKPLAPTVIKRGGVGFLTLTFMSTLAAFGGAYLGLYINANPQIATKIGIANYLPKGSNNGAEIAAIRAEIAAIKSEMTAHHANGATIPNTSANIAPNNTPDANNGTQIAPLQNVEPPKSVIDQAALGLAVKPIKDEMAGLSGRLTAIETRLAALDPTGTGGALIASLQTEIATLKVVVDDLKTRIAQTPSPAVTFAVISLAEASNRNGPFLPEFASVQAALPYLSEVTALEPLARSGAPTRALLAEKFQTLISGEQAEATEKAKPKTFGEWWRNLFKGVVKVENKEDTNSNGAILTRAKAKLDLGDLSGTIDELKTIQNPNANINSWINDANKRLDLEVKIAALRGAIERGLTIQPANQNALAPANQNTNNAVNIAPSANVVTNSIGSAK